MMERMTKTLLPVAFTLVGISLLAFFLLRMVPGDPVLMLLGERGADPAAYEKLRNTLGLNEPLLLQYYHFVSNALQGDLGNSIISNRPVLEEFLSRFPATVELGLLALFVAILLGIPLGILAAVKRNSFWDRFIVAGSLFGYSMPIFWWGLLLILLFSVTLGLTPVSGRISVLYDIPSVTGFMLIDSWLSEEGAKAFLSSLRHMVLPTMALATIPLAVITRMTRASLLDVLQEDYIRTAKAKGLSTFRTIGLHALRNALIPIVTVVGLMLGTLLTGAILTETIFSWPGIGKWLVHSVTSRDYPVVQGGILLIGTFITVLNMGIEVLYSAINPRLRKSR